MRTKGALVEKICPGCGQPFRTRKGNKKWHDRDCYLKHRSAEYHARNPAPRNPPAVTGVLNELRVVQDLVGRGYLIFTGLAPSNPFTMIAARDEAILRVQVRSGYRSPSGKIWASGPKGDADVLATCLPDRVIYEPELPDSPDPPELV